jgi:hypothetical protein
MTSIKDLPLACLDLIASYIADYDDEWRLKCQVAKDAAATALSGKSLHPLANMVYERLDPNSKHAIEFVHDNELAKLLREKSALSIPDIPIDAKLTDLKELCKKYNCAVSGTKDVLRGRIIRVQQDVDGKIKALDDKLHQWDKKNALKVWKCYVTRDVQITIESQRVRKVTASTAHTSYGLNDADLTPLRVEYKKNPHYRSAAPMRLYNLVQVVEAAVAKWGSKEKRHARSRSKVATNVVERKNTREERLMAKLYEIAQGDTTLVDEAMQSRIFCDKGDDDVWYDYVTRGKGTVGDVANTLLEMGKRVQELSAELQARQCELRADSRLCKSYVLYRHGSATSVGIAMEEMKFFYNHTDYPRLYNYHLANPRRFRYKIEDLRLEASAMAKEDALSQFAHAPDDPRVPSSLRKRLYAAAANGILELLLSDLQKQLALEPGEFAELRQRCPPLIAPVVRDSSQWQQFMEKTWFDPFIASMVEQVHALHEAKKRVDDWLANDFEMSSV